MTDLVGKKSLFAFLIALLVVINLGGVFTAEMMMENGAMDHCPFMGVSSLCSMSPLDHLSEWQQMFTTTVQQMLTATFLLLAVIIAWYFLKDLLIPRRTEKFLERYRDKERAFDPLRLVFARGILHSKAH